MTARHPRAGIRQKWVATVAHSDVNNACKTLMLYLAFFMNDHGKIKIPRKELAEVFGVHEQRIAERMKEARDAGLIHIVKGTGRSGKIAQYVAIPDLRTVQQYPLPHQRTDLQYPETGTQKSPNQGARVSEIGTHHARASVILMPERGGQAV